MQFLGNNDKKRFELIKSFISQWPMYSTPSDTIFEINEWKGDELKNTFNEVEKVLFSKILFLEDQYEKYKDIGHIIYNGSLLDILINSLVLCEQNYVSEEFVEKVIYHTKKMFRTLDALYIVPDDTLNETSDDDLKVLESVYWNFYENYQNDFENSPFFDQKNCSSIFMIDSTNPLGEIKMLLDKNGNLDTTMQGGSNENIVDLSRLKKIFNNNPALYKAAMQSLNSETSLNSGFITL